MKVPSVQQGQGCQTLVLCRNSSLYPLHGTSVARRPYACAFHCGGELRHASRRSFPPGAVFSSSSSSSAAGWEPPDDVSPNSSSQSPPAKRNAWAFWQGNAAEMRAKVAKLGLAAVLAYGLFDGLTYTSFFVLAFLGYEKSTGKNPAANIQALLGIVILMWTGNNVTRPLRVAGAAAAAPFVDRGLRKMQRVFNLPSQVFAFMVVVATFATLCLSVAGLLILSRWGK